VDSAPKLGPHLSCRSRPNPHFWPLHQVSDESTLLALAPDFNALAKIETRGVIVTCTHTSGQFNGVS
jgi:hypothetical protein